MAGRKDTMTDKERMEALLRREKPDRVPMFGMALGFTVVYSQTPLADVYNKPEVSLEAQKKTSEDFGWILTPMIGYAAGGGWEFGGDIKMPSGEFAQAPMITRFPVETEEDARNLKAPDTRKAGIVPIQEKFNKLQAQLEADNKPWKVAVMIDPGPFTLAGNLCTVEKLTKWMFKKPDIVHHLEKMAVDFTIARAQLWKGLFGTEGVLPFNAEATASNQIISPKQFEEFVLPHLKEEHQKLLDMGFKNIYCHICGEQNGNLPFWSQVPMGDPGLVSFGHEVDLETAAKYFPSDIIIGNIEPAIVQTGTADEVYEAAKVVIEKGKNLTTGYIFSPGCELPPMSPPENVMAMTRAINDFGWYD